MTTLYPRLSPDWPGAASKPAPAPEDPTTVSEPRCRRTVCVCVCVCVCVRVRVCGDAGGGGERLSCFRRRLPGLFFCRILTHLRCARRLRVDRLRRAGAFQRTHYQHAFLCIHYVLLCIHSAFLRIHRTTASCKRIDGQDCTRCTHKCHPRHPLSPLWLALKWHCASVRIHAHSKQMRLNAHQMHRNAVSWWKTTSTHTRIHASKPDAERGRKCTE